MATPTQSGTPVSIWEPTFVQSMGALSIWEPTFVQNMGALSLRNTIFVQSMGANATIPIGDLAGGIGWSSDKACILD